MAARAFQPANLGPVSLRNRIVKAATFEGVMPGGQVTDDLVDFHRRVGEGGVGMTTVAYLAVSPEGRTDRHCIVIRPEAVAGLRRLTDAVHATGAAVAAQIGHAGPVANARSNRAPALAPTRAVSLMGTVTHGATEDDIERITADYRRAAGLAVEAGFDSIEVHLGHNYLLSAFMSPKLNRRRDRWGGSLENRARFARHVVQAVRQEVGATAAVTAKLNMADGVAGGLWLEESIEIARLLAADGCLDALELTGGSSLANPMYLFRGEAPRREFAATLPGPVRAGFRLFGKRFLPRVPLRGGLLPPLRPAVPRRRRPPAHPARRDQPAGDDRTRPRRGVRLRGHGPGTPARARPRQPHGEGRGHRVPVRPLQQVHADHLPRHPLRPRQPLTRPRRLRPAAAELTRAGSSR